MEGWTFTRRTKTYFGLGPDLPPRKPSWIRLVASFLVVVAVSVGMLLLGIPNAGFPIVVAAVLVIGNALYRRRKLMTPTDPQGCRMDPDGNYQWWSGSAFTDPPAGETPRKIGPEIEW